MGFFYKLARPDGWDFYTGKTINYRENIGEIVYCPRRKGRPELCSSTVIHASKNPNDAFAVAHLPCSVYRVEGTPLVKDHKKAGFTSFRVIEEIPQEKLDSLFGWKYLEACNPVHPFKIQPPEIGKDQKRLLKQWASVRDSVWASVGDSVGDSVRDSVWASVGDSVWASVRDSVWASVGDSVRDSVWASVGDSVRDSVWASVGDSVRDSVWASVWASVRDSVWASVEAYIGSLFSNIKRWKYVKNRRGEYPFQSAVDLWKQGLVASFDKTTWRLHGGPEGRILFVKEDVKEGI
jgi:hypothetical protein